MTSFPGRCSTHSRISGVMAFVRPILCLCLVVGFLLLMVMPAIESTLQPRAPNFQYFERPKYRYPYYDETGKGKLLYGYGGSDLYQYKSYSPLEGIH